MIYFLNRSSLYKNSVTIFFSRLKENANASVLVVRPLSCRRYRVVTRLNLKYYVNSHIWRNKNIEPSVLLFKRF